MVSTIQLQFDLEGCQNAKQDTFQAVPAMHEVASELMSTPTDVSVDSVHAVARNRKKKAFVDEPDLGAMFQVLVPTTI